MESAHQPIITDTKPAAARTRQPRPIGSRPFADLIGRLQSEEASLPALQRSGFSRGDSYVRVPDGCKLAQRRRGDQETADGVITRQGKGSGTKTFYIYRKRILAHGTGCPGIVSTVRCTVPWVEIPGTTPSTCLTPSVHFSFFQPPPIALRRVHHVDGGQY
jgi:hypothetical protein